jgi:hypothetical protein
MSASVPSEAALRRARRRHTVQLIVTSVTVFVVLALLSVLEDGLTPLDPARFAILAGVMAGVTLLMLGLRRLGVRWLQPSAAMGLDKAGRKAAARALRRPGTVPPEHRAGTVAVARDVLRHRWAPWFFLVVAGMNGWFAATEPGTARWVHAVCAVLGLGLAGWYLVALRRARAIEADAAGPPSGGA